MALIRQPRDTPILRDQDDDSEVRMEDAPPGTPAAAPPAVETPRISQMLLTRANLGEDLQVPWIRRYCGGCCRTWKTVDAFMLFICLLSLVSSLVLAVILVVNKENCKGNCILKAHYSNSNNIIYDIKSMWLCDALLFFTFFPATILFTFIMVDWVAQKKNSTRWIQIKIGLVVVIIVGYCVFVPFLFVGYAIWCERMKTDLVDNFPLPTSSPNTIQKSDVDEPGGQSVYPKSCVGTASYLDTRMHTSEKLAKVHALITAAMGVGISCVVFYTLLVGSLAYKLYDVVMDMKIMDFNTALNTPEQQELRSKMKEPPPFMTKQQRLFMERQAQARTGYRARERADNGSIQTATAGGSNRL